MIKAVIIDDELKSCQILDKMLSNYCSTVQVLAFAHSAKEGIEIVKKHEPELVFLDIEMPGGDGFYLLNNLEKKDFSTVFITAYDHYAVKAFKFAALDYILKPVNIGELRQAVQRCTERTNQQNSSHYQTLTANQMQGNFSKLAVPNNKGYDFVSIEEILWLQASDRYTIMYLKDKRQIVSSYNLGKYEELLSESLPFLRIHHSHIVNLNEVVQVMRMKNLCVRLSDGHELEVSSRKKDSLLALIKK